VITRPKKWVMTQAVLKGLEVRRRKLTLTPFSGIIVIMYHMTLASHANHC
jgi:hypothetical protein